LSGWSSHRRGRCKSSRPRQTRSTNHLSALSDVKIGLLAIKVNRKDVRRCMREFHASTPSGEWSLDRHEIHKNTEASWNGNFWQTTKRERAARKGVCCFVDHRNGSSGDRGQPLFQSRNFTTVAQLLEYVKRMTDCIAFFANISA
jgi:hypothetical protein